MEMWMNENSGMIGIVESDCEHNWHEWMWGLKKDRWLCVNSYIFVQPDAVETG